MPLIVLKISSTVLFDFSTVVCVSSTVLSILKIGICRAFVALRSATISSILSSTTFSVSYLFLLVRPRRWSRTYRKIAFQLLNVGADS